jgi:16S rRNA (cytidine1402-2'-O)-methyltransferase
MALVSDAGTPTVSDPGYRLVRLARQAGLRVVPIPGPVAAMAALSVSGLPTDEFLFVGFLPPRQEARRRRLEGLAGQRATLILYEAPQRVRQTLTDILETLGDREAFVGREITKLHEECRLGPVSSLVDQVTARGEVVIVVAGADPSPEKLAGVDLEGMSRQDIVKLAARSLGVRRNELYARLFRKDGSDSE